MSHTKEMIIPLSIFLLSFPVLFANISISDFEKVVKEKELTTKKLLAETEALQKEKAKLRADFDAYKQKKDQLEASIKTTSKTDDELMEIYKAQSEKLTEFSARFETLRKKQDELEAKFVSEKLNRATQDYLLRKNFSDESTHHYKMETLNKTLVIHVDPTYVLRSLDNLDNPPLVGSMVWDTALVLSKYLEMSCKNKSWIRGKRVTDLGAGTGYVGIVAACLGGDVTLADLFEMLPLLQKNIDANSKQIKGTGGQIRAKSLCWGDKQDIKSIPKQDIILLSNVIYHNASLEPLISTVVALSKKGTRLLVCQEIFRDSIWDMFIDQISKYFDLTSISPDGYDVNKDSKNVYLVTGNFK